MEQYTAQHMLPPSPIEPPLHTFANSPSKQRLKSKQLKSSRSQPRLSIHNAHLVLPPIFARDQKSPMAMSPPTMPLPSADARYSTVLTPIDPAKLNARASLQPLKPTSLAPSHSKPPQYSLPPTPPITPTFPAHAEFTSTLPSLNAPSLTAPSLRAPPATPDSVSARHLTNHTLDHDFTQKYSLGPELGSGGFGFVLAAKRRSDEFDVAVKFIIKEKVPAGGLVDASAFAPAGTPLPRMVPLEVYVLGQIKHPNIVKLYDLYEDDAFFYVVMELFGASWTTPKPNKEANTAKTTGSLPALAAAAIAAATATCQMVFEDKSKNAKSPLLAAPTPAPRLNRRPSCDLFECIEMHHKLSEPTARAITRQIVDVVSYLDGLGICHRDIKDENIVVDDKFKVKLIDFGSAVIMPHSPLHPNAQPRLRRARSDLSNLKGMSNAFYLTRFHGTLNFASPEILRGAPYRPQPAEIWSIGVLLYTLLTGETPFRQPMDAMTREPRAFDQLLGKIPSSRSPLSPECRAVLLACFVKDPERRITVHQLAKSSWLKLR